MVWMVWLACTLVFAYGAFGMIAFSLGRYDLAAFCAVILEPCFLFYGSIFHQRGSIWATLVQ